ncbi:NlpC/P60 family protein [Bacillus sonorensis]|uniref:C40 family peptidase n=1 Tax=Bacillus sonorensis TaxID=119858 RepID=UPI002DBDA590|nr:NlpC/P60 family protein [Bacillus sonorensis]MEC1354182.1 NlpC/P60 family protein [Bacillus sonorensis]MEC1424899.1 NlpC/P60 family protein [Bacillus sonorensis]MEC1438192.1 NlpC/P60 family protein [Bacillus sonorensis]
MKKKTAHKQLLMFIGMAVFLMFSFLPGEKAAKPQTKGESIAETAKKLEGKKYTYGGASPKEGFDPSGFVQYVFQEALDIPLPRTVKEQAKIGTKVNRQDLEQGDIVFFKNGALESDGPTHVAIYLGEDQIIHSTKSNGVAITKLEGSAYWSSSYDQARRITEEPEISKDPVVQKALNYVGVPYVFGSASPDVGFDCSGLTQYVFREALGVYLPRSAEQQWAVGKKVKLEDIQPGDVIFFSNTYKPGISHNGIYAGGGRFIHASRSDKVTISYLSASYWQKKFTGIRRFDNLSLPDNPIVSEAIQYIGEVGYKKGGTTPQEGFDTSGFIQYVYKTAAGIELPRYADKQYKAGTKITKQELEPGDLVFFQGTTVLHPAIYIGNGQVVLVTLSSGVTAADMETSAYWKDKYVGSVRIQ